MNSTQDDLSRRIEALSDDKLSRVLRQLLSEIDVEPAVTEEEQSIRRQEDEILFQQIAAGLKLHSVASGPDLLAVTLAIAQEVPEVRPTLERALDVVENEAVTLDFGAGLALGILVTAIAGAILRPRVKVIVEETSNEQGGVTTKQNVDVQIRGVKNIEKLLSTFLPFVS